MKLAVTRCDGDTEIIMIHDPVRISDGPWQACIHGSDGIDHFFRIEDGRYDGYGLAAPEQGWTPQQAKTMCESFHSGRQIIPVTIRGVLMQKIRKVWVFVRWHIHHFIGTEGF